MSVFKVRDWWSTKLSSDDYYTSLVIGNVDNAKDGLDKIVVSSLQGFLRFFLPKPSPSGDSTMMPAEDQLFETQISDAILQIAIGHFSSASSDLHLAMLNQRKLTVYSVVVSSGNVGHGNFYQLNQIYEHKLQRVAYNFCIGQFGGHSEQASDYICVQSVDCTLSVFEQETFSFLRFLPNSLIPGPLLYLPSSDSILTFSSCLQLEAYKYQVLAIAADSKSKQEQEVRSGKKVTADWTLNLGDDVSYMETVHSKDSSVIFVLAAHNIFYVSDSGELLFMKKFEIPSLCCLPLSCADSFKFILANTSKQLMIFENTFITWAAKLDSVPTHLALATIQGVKGTMVSLDDQGWLQCLYLGTDPAAHAIPNVTESRDIDFANYDNEMERLQKAIRDKSRSGLDTMTMPAEKQETLKISVQVDAELSYDSGASDDRIVPAISAHIKISCESITSGPVQVHIESPSPITCSKPDHQLPPIHKNTPQQLDVSFAVKGSGVATDLIFVVTANCSGENSAPSSARAEGVLPLKLITQVCPPSKSGQFKITIDTNREAVDMVALFNDFSAAVDNGCSATAFGLQFVGSEETNVTILASTKSQRYRLQSDVFEAMWPILRALIKRLETKLNPAPLITYQSTLPISDYMKVVDQHLQCRLKQKKMLTDLDTKACEFRKLQRLLLTKFKDKTPTPLADLDALLESSYRSLIDLSDEIQKEKDLQTQLVSRLNSATRLFSQLVRLSTKLNEQESKLLDDVLSPIVHETSDLGWEELTDASITHILRTKLATKSTDTHATVPMTMPEDTGKLYKHISLLCERLLGKKSSFVAVNSKNNLSGSGDSNLTSMGLPSIDELKVPMGSSFAGRKSPKQGAQPSFDETAAIPAAGGDHGFFD